MLITQPLFVILLAVLVFCADQAITNGIARGFIRAIAYGVVAILALIAVIVLIGVK